MYLASAASLKMNSLLYYFKTLPSESQALREAKNAIVLIPCFAANLRLKWT